MFIPRQKLATPPRSPTLLQTSVSGLNISCRAIWDITRLPHQTSLTSSVDVEDRKTLREALYQGIFHRHRRSIFAVGSFLRMLRSRNSQYNTIRSSSEGEDVDEQQQKNHQEELKQSQEHLHPSGQQVSTTSTASPSGPQHQSDSV
ncbi:uncharacterized protein LOC108033363 isoform X4 [Drosophila biarmipes]|uniref:uncharacterized protein LOC108033363 isoform X4 n=1 Tax=Drosophila biarmipes TaxID=125945 RepID=UPI001CDB3A1C|nr:uncharacterized protein LOC108033363 isoform X4 [Drosophila biarmipes]